MVKCFGVELAVVQGSGFVGKAGVQLLAACTYRLAAKEKEDLPQTKSDRRTVLGGDS